MFQVTASDSTWKFVCFLKISLQYLTILGEVSLLTDWQNLILSPENLNFSFLVKKCNPREPLKSQWSDAFGSSYYQFSDYIPQCLVESHSL